jgi:hypothetical protein
MKRPELHLGPPETDQLLFASLGRSPEEDLARVLDFYDDALERTRHGALKGRSEEEANEIRQRIGAHVSDAREFRTDLEENLNRWFERWRANREGLSPLEPIAFTVASAYLSGILIGIFGARLAIDPSDFALAFKTRDERSRGGRAFIKGADFKRWQQEADAFGRRNPNASLRRAAQHVKNALGLMESLDTIRRRIKRSW